MKYEQTIAVLRLTATLALMLSFSAALLLLTCTTHAGPYSVATQPATQDADSATEPPAGRAADLQQAVDQSTSQLSDTRATDVNDLANTSDDADAESDSEVMIQNDAVVFGILMAILGFVFWSSQSSVRAFRAFYKVVPVLLMCYFLPSLLTLFRLVDPEASKLYFVASRFLLPASLVLLTLSVDLNEIVKLGPKALIMFFTGTVGVVLGGPLAMLLVHFFAPSVLAGEGDDAVWRGMSTVAGSWIGGGANQTAMKELFHPSEKIFSAMVAVDILVAEFWMMFLLLGIGKRKMIDHWLKADSSAVDRLQSKMESYSQANSRIATTPDLFAILGVAFGATAIAHAIADQLAPWIKSHYPGLSRISFDNEFFWLIVIATVIGVGLSFTRARTLEGAGASKIGTLFIYVLVATIGLKMDLAAIYTYKGFFLVGLIWMAIHVGLLAVVAFAIKAPYFFLAVGSKANIGGAASAPVVAAAFHPALAPVGVLLAVLGYVLGTFGAWICGLMMKAVST